jgi:hypothetical protein
MPAKPHLRRLSAIVAAILTLVPVGPTDAAERDLIVRYDQSQLLRLPRPVAEIIIGNPSIADVTVQANTLLVVTGKTFGVTNLIVLDADRKIIQEQRIIVERDENRVVNLHKAGLRQSYSCTPNCSPTLTIGDDKEYFDMVEKHGKAKTGFSGGESSQSPQGGGGQ